MASRRESSLKKNENRVLLGRNYRPGHNAVICGRGKACSSSPGNKKLRAYVDSFAKSYGDASNKEQKSKIVSTIISLIEEPEGGAFVKFEERAWWKVDEAYAREKIGNLFRDVLHTKYRSSSKAKQARKRKVPTASCGFHDEITSIATKLQMDQSHSSMSSAGSTMCNWNLGCTNGPTMPSSAFPLGGVLSSMSSQMGCSSRYGYGQPQQQMQPEYPYHDLTGRLLNFCNQALNITSSVNTQMSRAALCGHPDTARFLAFQNSDKSVVTPEKTRCIINNINIEPAMNASVSNVTDGVKEGDIDDEVSIATFADDDIFNDFLKDRVDDLSVFF